MRFGVLQVFQRQALVVVWVHAEQLEILPATRRQRRGHAKHRDLELLQEVDERSPHDLVVAVDLVEDHGGIGERRQ
jgi:hypothetical protein